MSPAIAEQSFRGIDADTRAKLDSLPSNDEVLADAIKQSRVVVGEAGTAIPTQTPPGEAALQTGFAIRGPDPTPYLVTFPGMLRNVPPIEEAAAGRGLFSINPEHDGIIRRVPVIMEAQGTLVPSLTMEMLRVVTHSGAILVRVNQAGVQSVAVPGLEVPTDRNGQLWVHFNKHDPARYVSAKDVLQGNVAPDRFRGRLVLIGTSAIGLARPQDDAGRGGDAGRRGACADSRKRVDQIAAGQPELCHRRRAHDRGAVRARHHRRRADAVGDGRSCCSARS